MADTRRTLTDPQSPFHGPPSATNNTISVATQATATTLGVDLSGMWVDRQPPLASAEYDTQCERENEGLEEEPPEIGRLFYLVHRKTLTRASRTHQPIRRRTPVDYGSEFYLADTSTRAEFRGTEIGAWGKDGYETTHVCIGRFRLTQARHRIGTWSDPSSASPGEWFVTLTEVRSFAQAAATAHAVLGNDTDPDALRAAARDLASDADPLGNALFTTAATARAIADAETALASARAKHGRALRRLTAYKKGLALLESARAQTPTPKPEETTR